MNKLANHTLYNGCKGCLPPNWANYTAVEVRPVLECDGVCEALSYKDKHLAQFWSVYAKCHDETWDVITDVSTAKLAESIALMFATKHHLVFLI